jgi:hypothetical protein
MDALGQRAGRGAFRRRIAVFRFVPTWPDTLLRAPDVAGGRDFSCVKAL